MINMFTVEKYCKGDVITKCGDPISRIVVIRSGQVSVWKHPEPQNLNCSHDQFEHSDSFPNENMKESMRQYEVKHS
jgi:signal-transduction protein with cAMP-binding, CBS, and nucleotidyltransferase domain